MKLTNRSGKSGFTLIEVIAVLLILAVLAAVAVPSYLNLIDDARTQALNGALAAGQSSLALAYAQYTLANSDTPTEAQLVAAVGTGPAGDFTYTFTAGTGTVNVKADDTSGATANVDWPMP